MSPPKARAIFYDLETTDSSPLGQIINFCFTATDAQFHPLDQLTDEIRISRLQLPAPEAIVVNRVNVLELQKRAALSEAQALERIHKFIHKHVSSSPGAFALVGFNSNSFDQNFLRTSLIRNGLNPYFKAAQRDLYHLAKHLFVQQHSFRELMLEINGEGKPRPTLRLESIASRLGLLKGSQTHHSADDVELTMRLAAHFREIYQADILEYDSYEPKRLPRSASQRGALLWQAQPAYHAQSEALVNLEPMCLLDQHERGALWIALDRFEESEDRSSIVWFGKESKSFVALEMRREDRERFQPLADRALRKLETICLDNYFEPLVCDIEAHIYRVGAASIDTLHDALARRQTKLLGRSEDLRELYLRSRLANYEWGSGHDEQVRHELREFALKRYGGTLLVEKLTEKRVKQGEAKSDDFYPSLAERMQRIDRLWRDGNAEDRVLLEALRTFYLQSEIFGLVGEQLTAPIAA